MNEINLKLERDLQVFYRSVWSPFCPGRSLADCPTEQAEQLREEIRQLFLKRIPKSEIIKEINQKYNQEMLSEPQGVHVLVSLVPLGVFFIIALLIFKKTLRYRNR